jgi:protein transport protein SEC31
MNLQELNRSATLAWSPLPNQPQLLATGTIAGTLGLDFDTSSHLEIFSLNIGKHNKEPTLLGSTTAADRFHKLVWGMMGVNNGTLPYGLLAGALSNGAVQIWNPEKIIK